VADDRLIGDFLRRALPDHVTDRGRQRGAQRDQRRDIRFRHAISSPRARPQPVTHTGYSPTVSTNSLWR